MKRSFFFFLFFFTINLSWAQLQWTLMHSYLSKNIIAWDVDPMGKVIISKRDVLIKLDTSFNIQFSQSNKRFGEVSKIDARHSLKSLVFSKDQQLVGFIDNTLTFQEGIKELSEENVSYATDVCYSGQTNRYWVYDADNSKLILFDSSLGHKSEINNLAAITGESEPTSIFESHNQLILFYKGIGAYIFDYYGSLIRFIEDSKMEAVHTSKDYLYFIETGQMFRLNLKTLNKISIDLPTTDISEFRIFENYVFFKTSKGIKKYFLNQQ
jgi:hypothetical protein